MVPTLSRCAGEGGPAKRGRLRLRDCDRLLPGQKPMGITNRLRTISGIGLPERAARTLRALAICVA